MLGDIVEFGFNVSAGAHVELGQTIGSIEGFKAVSDIYSVATGEFLGGNPALDGDITLLDSKPYGEGWIYQVQGVPDPAATGLEGYVAILDATIDKMLESRHE
jgi:glycine cleavage system H protein